MALKWKGCQHQKLTASLLINEVCRWWQTNRHLDSLVNNIHFLCTIHIKGFKLCWSSRLVKLLTPHEISYGSNYFVFWVITEHMDKYSWGCHNIKILSFQHKNFHDKDKLVSRPADLYNGNTMPGKVLLILKKGPGHFMEVYSDRPSCWTGSNFPWQTSSKMALFWRLLLRVPCTVTMAGKLLTVMTVQGDCIRVCFAINRVKSVHWNSP